MADGNTTFNNNTVVTNFPTTICYDLGSDPIKIAPLAELNDASLEAARNYAFFSFDITNPVGGTGDAVFGIDLTGTDFSIKLADGTLSKIDDGQYSGVFGIQIVDGQGQAFASYFSDGSSTVSVGFDVRTGPDDTSQPVVSPATADAIIQSFTFSSTATVPGQQTLDVSFVDDDGGDGDSFSVDLVQQVANDDPVAADDNLAPPIVEKNFDDADNSFAFAVGGGSLQDLVIQSFVAGGESLESFTFIVHALDLLNGNPFDLQVHLLEVSGAGSGTQTLGDTILFSSGAFAPVVGANTVDFGGLSLTAGQSYAVAIDATAAVGGNDAISLRNTSVNAQETASRISSGEALADLTGETIHFNDFDVSTELKYAPAPTVTEDDVLTIVVADLLENDSDPDANDTFSLTEVEAVSALGAAVTLNLDPNGDNHTISYNPLASVTLQSMADGETLTDTFTYTITDAQGATDTATVSLVVSGVNGAPVVSSTGTPEIDENDQLVATTTELLNGLVDEENHVLAVTSVTQGQNGTVVLDDMGTTDTSDDTVTYTPDANFNGADTFTYTVTDSQGASTPVTVNVTVDPVQNAPVVDTENNTTTFEDTFFYVSSVASFSDADPEDTITLTFAAYDGTFARDTPGGLVTVSSFDNGSNSYSFTGTQAEAATELASLVYVPKPNSEAEDSLNFGVFDGTSQASGVTNISITAQDDDPVISGVTFPDGSEIAESGDSIDMVLNFSDPDLSDSHYFFVETQPLSGTVTSNGDGTFTYTVDFDGLSTGENPIQIFRIGVGDSNIATDSTEVTVTVIGEDDAPEIASDSVGMIAAVGEDGGSIPQITGELNADGANWSDVDFSDPALQLTYAVNDAAGEPAAQFSFDAQTGEAAVDGEYGTLYVTSSGAYRYVLDETRDATKALAQDDTASESFTYTIFNGFDVIDSTTGKLTISVTGANDAPVAENDVLGASGTIYETFDPEKTPDSEDAAAFDNASSGPRIAAQAFVALDTELEQVVINVGQIDEPNELIVSIRSYDAATDTFGEPLFTSPSLSLTSSDEGEFAISTGNVALTIGERYAVHFETPDLGATAGGFRVQNASPEANATEEYVVGDPSNPGTVLAFTGFGIGMRMEYAASGHPSDQALSLSSEDLLGNDSDDDAGDVLTVELAENLLSAQGASVTIDENGLISYDPTSAQALLALQEGETVTDTFVYTVSDGNGGTDTATASIKVAGVNDDPVAVDDVIAGTVNVPGTSVNNLSDDDGATPYGLNFGEWGPEIPERYAYSAQTFVAQGASLDSLKFEAQYNTFRGNDDVDFSVLVVEVVDDTNGLQLGAILYNSDTSADASEPLMVEKGSGITEYTVETGGLSLKTGSKYAIVFNTGQYFDDVSGLGTLEGIRASRGPTDGSVYSLQIVPTDDIAADLSSTGWVEETRSDFESGETVFNDILIDFQYGAISGTPVDAPIVIDTAALLANDTDVDNESTDLTVTGVSATSASGAVVTLDTDTGEITYDGSTVAAHKALKDGEAATDTFTYTISDGAGGTATATASLTVLGVNDAPVAADDVFPVEADVTGEFLVNTVAAGGQEQSAVEQLDGGRFVVAWLVAGDIYAQLFEANGNPVGAEIKVSDVDGGQFHPSISALRDGGFVVSWATSLSSFDGSLDGIAARTFDVDGVAGQPSPFVVNQLTTSTQSTPAVSGLADGGFIAVWANSDSDFDGDQSGIAARVFDASFVAQGNDILVNSETQSRQFDPEVTTLTNGNSVITWGTRVGDALKAQIVDPSGTAIGGEFRINSEGEDTEGLSQVTALKNGGFVVVWHIGNLDSPDEEAVIKGQVFDSAGAKVGSEFLVNSELVDEQNDADVASLDNGGFVVVWTSEDETQDGSGSAVKAQVFDAGGNKTGSEFFVNSEGFGHQEAPAVTGLDNGRFVVSWTTSDPNQDGDGRAIKAQIFNNDGTPSTEAPYKGDEVLDLAVSEILDNDSDVDGDTLSVSAVNGLSTMGATLTLSEDGSTVTYDPTGAALVRQLAAGEVATDVITYTVSDGNGGTDTATISISIAGTNEAPTLDEIPSLATNEDGNVSIDLKQLASDVDNGDTAAELTYQASVTSGEGTVEIVDGVMTFTPGDTYQSLAVGDSGQVELTVFATDANGAVSETRTVQVTVEGRNDIAEISGTASGTLEEDAREAPVLGQLLTNTNPSPNDQFGISVACRGTGAHLLSAVSLMTTTVKSRTIPTKAQPLSIVWTRTVFSSLKPN